MIHRSDISGNWIQKGIILLVLMFICQTTLNAQYFGRNKVHYENFDFSIMHTDHFRLYYYPKGSGTVKHAAAMLERWNSRFAKIFGTGVGSDQPIVLYSNHADFQQTNILPDLIPQGTGGVTEGMQNRIVLPFTGVNSENNHVLGHELVHAFQYNIIRSSAAGLSGAGNVPLWFIEGMAEYLSIGRRDPLTAMWLRDAVLNNDIPTIDDVSEGYKYFPYRYGHAIWAYIGGTYGDQVVNQLMRGGVARGFETAVDSILGIKVDSLSKNWQNALRTAYQPLLAGRTRPDSTGYKILDEKEIMNLAPVISPDGKYIAVFSSRELFSIDLYLADAKSGEIMDKLVSSNTDAHFEAMRFINSAGTWSPDSKQFAFIIFKGGDNGISIVNVDKRKVTSTFKLKEVDEITSIAWSPDGNRMALSGTSEGISDIYIYDLKTKNVERLTRDNYSEIQPTWSPDGKTIAFASDMGPETRIENFQFGPMKIVLMDLETRRTRLLSVTENSKNINPQYSPDGRSVYMIADPEGISDIFRYSFDEDRFYRVTHVATGISGITELSPALSVSSQSGQLVYNIFNKRDYSVYGLEPRAAAGEPFEREIGEYAINISLPPATPAGKDIVFNYLNEPGQGFSKTENYRISDYNPAFRLVYAGQMGVGIAVDRYGSGIGGGASFLFSDVLNDHMIGVDAMANGSFKDIGGQLTYLNLGNRFNWGVAAGFIPYQSVRVGYGLDTVNINGGNYLADEIQLYRERLYNSHFMVMGSYPLSMNRRFEINATYTHLAFGTELESIVSIGDQILSRDTRDIESPKPLNFIQAAFAYVGDYSFFGFTSPIMGRRYRFEVEPTFGSLQFTSILADYRQYFFTNPVTFAFRAFHYGRYAKDAENPNLTPLYLGYDSWVRGYNLNSIDGTECVDAGGAGNCNDFDRLIGSKVGVFNAEIRLPVFGTDQFGLINFPYLPLELSAFFDGGVAWTESEKPVIKFEKDSPDRIPVFSAGLTARVNILGYIIGEIFYAYPFQRPEQGWQFGFQIAPGW